LTKRFIITGCGRSGTRYISHLLTNIGLECTHEIYFPHHVYSNYHIIKYYLAKLGLIKLKWGVPPYGEAAWEAAPFLQYLPSKTIVFHQIRHPLDYIKSRQLKGLVYLRIRKHFTNISFDAGTIEDFFNLPLGRQVNYLAKFWIEWNKLVESNSKGFEYYRYKVEDLNENKIAFMLSKVNYEYDRDVLAYHVNIIDKNIHTQNKKKNENISFDMLESNVYNELHEISKRYGYSI
jgi:hypothetical protein